MSDHALLAGIASRDPEAFRTLMERYSCRVINLAHRFLGNIADAEDVAQDVFLRLYQNPPRLGPTGRLFTWLYRVTVNRSLDLVRSRGRNPRMLSLDEPMTSLESETAPLADRIPAPSSGSPREQMVQAELAEFTRRAVAALPVPLRAPLVLSTLEELSHGEIAQILRISPKAVERRLSRARELLKARLLPHP